MDAISPDSTLRSPPPERMAAYGGTQLIDATAWLVLAVLAVAAAFTFREYGLGWDDYTHSQYGAHLLRLYGSGFRDTTALSFVNLYLYGGGFDMAAGLLHKIVPFDLFETRRLLGATVGIAGLAVTWRIGRRVGGPLAGLIALMLLAACPLYYGHMFMNAKDAPFAAAMALFLLGLVRLLQQYPKPCVTTLALVTLGFGLSIGSRILAGFGVLEAFGALALLIAIEMRAGGTRSAGRRLGHVVLLLIPCAIIAYAIMGLIWPWGVLHPLNPIVAIETFSEFFEKPWRELFNGALLQPPDMPRTYVVTLLALKLPVVFLLLGALGVGGGLIAAFRGSLPTRRRAVYFVIVLAAALPVAATIITRPAMYNGVRHFLFILPPLAVAGGLAAVWIVERASRHGQAAAVGLAAIFAAGVALPAIAMAKLHPYEYVSFNEIAGGVKGAQSRFMLDYWGLAFKQAGQELRAKLDTLTPPAGRSWKVAVCGPHPPAHIAIGDPVDLTWDTKGADFAMMLGTFYCAKLDAPLVVDIVRDGVTFARVYDIRGRSIPSVFTTPPLKQD
jgi:4-amino-4-deoxy-L-arabinose transferase-like glycosyltransferase